MRALRVAPCIGFLLTLALGASVVAETPVYEVERLLPMQHVNGSMLLDPAESLGDFSVDGRIFQHRGVPVTGAPLVMDDPRLSGRLESTWNWDVHASGTSPVAAWGVMRIDTPSLATINWHGDDKAVVEVGFEEGAWVGDFTGIRRADGEPFAVRAFLLGEGAYEGLCATLDIEAGSEAWLADGVIHPVPMAG